ncbi:hypothetical protein ACOALA_04130 [Alicyclobacillus acidoterrestris]|uniref:hypothetical protein n=1 Tax=Alicyclobacillus acidoterrestris TaxID=1450 RepID=UPI003F52C127
MKWAVWIIGFGLLLGVPWLGLNVEDNWIQYVSAFPMVWAGGLAVSHWRLLKYIKHLPDIHRMVQELHEKHIGS